MQCIFRRYKLLCANKDRTETTNVNEGCTERFIILLHKNRYHNAVHIRNSTHIYLFIYLYNIFIAHYS